LILLLQNSKLGMIWIAIEVCVCRTLGARNRAGLQSLLLDRRMRESFRCQRPTLCCLVLKAVVLAAAGANALLRSQPGSERIYSGQQMDCLRGNQPFAQAGSFQTAINSVAK